MAFIDELAKRLGEVVKKVGEKSEELVELGKLNYEIFREEDTIKRLYREIGQAVYEAYKQENNSLDAIYRLCQEIDEHREKIEGLKKRVENIKKEMQEEGAQAEKQPEAQHASRTGEQDSAQPGGAQETKQGVGGETKLDAGGEMTQGNNEKNVQEGI
ncbi:MAG: hypothetical protein PWR01_1487 [Clostridiales bacterium]|nr:hypothetical protein [Clostridiales bacterium]